MDVSFWCRVSFEYWPYRSAITLFQTNIEKHILYFKNELAQYGEVYRVGFKKGINGARSVLNLGHEWDQCGLRSEQ